MNTYRALTPAAVVMFADGVFEADLSASEEKDWLDRGLIEIVPRPYRVLSGNYVAGERQDDGTVTLALLRENEEALIAAGHLGRVEKPAAKAASRKGK